MKGPKFFKGILSLVMIFIKATEVFAQKPPPPAGKMPDPPIELEAPIDQYLPHLLFVGLAFGLYWAFRQIKSHRSRD
jgi:hypothetical protein